MSQRFLHDFFGECDFVRSRSDHASLPLPCIKGFLDISPPIILTPPGSVVLGDNGVASFAKTDAAAIEARALSLRNRDLTYRALLDDGSVGRKCLEYISLLRRYDCGLTDAQAAKLLGWPRSSVSARRNDVLSWWKRRIDNDGGHFIVSFGRRKNPGVGSRMGVVWRLV